MSKCLVTVECPCSSTAQPKYIQHVDQLIHSSYSNHAAADTVTGSGMPRQIATLSHQLHQKCVITKPMKLNYSAGELRVYVSVYLISVCCMKHNTEQKLQNCHSLTTSITSDCEWLTIYNHLSATVASCCHGGRNLQFGGWRCFCWQWQIWVTVKARVDDWKQVDVAALRLFGCPGMR